MRNPLLAVAVATALNPVAAPAQHPLVLQTLKSWNDAAPAPASDVIIGAVLKAALTVQKTQGGCVPTAAVIEGFAPATGVRFVMTAVQQRQLKNAWTVVARHPNCGPEVARYAVLRGADDGVAAFRINQGRSNTNESLFGDTLPLATIAAGSALQRQGVKCDADAFESSKLGVTRIAEEEPDLGPEIYGIRYNGSWSEVWPLTLCGRTAEVTIKFRADGDGGAYQDIKGGLVKILPAGQ